jgi:hypothetical protein
VRLDEEDIEDIEEAPDDELQQREEETVDQAAAARTIAELKIEIETLQKLETLSLEVRRSGQDKKWVELSELLSHVFAPARIQGSIQEPPAPYRNQPSVAPISSPSQKLVIFTEHRDTLSYLEQRVSTLLGRKEAIVSIHGGIGRRPNEHAGGVQARSRSAGFDRYRCCWREEPYRTTGATARRVRLPRSSSAGRDARSHFWKGIATCCGEVRCSWTNAIQGICPESSFIWSIRFRMRALREPATVESYRSGCFTSR